MKRKRMLSPTAINTYLRCPRKYYLRYVKRLKGKPSIYLVKGIAVHEALAKFYDLNFGEETLVAELRLKLVDLFNKEWEKQAKTLESIDLNTTEIDEHYTECVNMLYGWFYRFMEQNSLGLEKPETEVKLFSRKHNLMGVIDVIHHNDGKAVLVDYKTSAKDVVTEDIKVQMALYALLFEANYGKLPDRIVVDFLATGSKKIFPVDREIIQWAERLCRELDRKTESNMEEDYPCTCGGWCERDFEHNEGASSQRKAQAA